VIEPAEAMLAITGIGMLTGERKDAISEDEIVKARELESTIETRAKSCMSGTLDPRVPPAIDYERTLKRLSKLQDVNDHAERAAMFPPGYHKLATVYNVLLHQLQSEVAKMLPRQTWESVTGTEVGPPTDLAFWKFQNILHIIDEPMTVFRLICNGMLGKKQALALKTIYPSLAQAITTALVECAVNKKASSKGQWRPGWKLNKGLAAWFESSAIPPDLLKRLQQAHVHVDQPPPQQDASGQGGAQAASPSDRAQFGVVK